MSVRIYGQTFRAISPNSPRYVLIAIIITESMWIQVSKQPF